MSNTPKNGDFAAYVDDIQLRQQRALHLPTAPKPPAANVFVGDAANRRKEAQASTKPSGQHSAHRADAHDPHTTKHNASSHAALADHVFGRTANDAPNAAASAAAKPAARAAAVAQAKEKEAANDADEAATLAPPQDAWEARWQPVFLFVAQNRSKFIGMMLAIAVTIVCLITVAVALAAMLGVDLGLDDISNPLIKSKWLEYWMYWTQTVARTKILLLLAFAVIAVCVRYIAKTWQFIVEFAARESDINTFIGLLLGLALLEAVMFFKIGISAVVWVAVLLGGGATKSAWRVIAAARRALLKLQPA